MSFHAIVKPFSSACHSVWYVIDVCGRFLSATRFVLFRISNINVYRITGLLEYNLI